MRPLERLRNYLAHQSGIGTVSHSEATVAALEKRYGVRLPDDFREYLRTSCPATCCFDDNVTEWWQLDRIKNIAEECDHPVGNVEIETEKNTYLVFADYMIWSSAWAINCGEGPNRGRIVTIGPDAFVANTFDEFIEEYMADAGRAACPTNP